MRMFQRAAVATVTAGSLVFLGAGVSYAGDMGHKKADRDVTISIKNVKQNCSNKTEKQKIVAKGNKRSHVGNTFSCVQSIRVG